MIRLCVIGDPIGHSRSPAIHTRLLKKAGLAGTYEAVRVSADALPDFVAAARAGRWDGFNVTMPHKESVLPLLDSVSPTSEAIGVVNTVVIRHGRAIGYNTDAPGFLRTLSFSPEGKRALVLGNGGASAAVVYALRGAGAAVTVCARHPRPGQRPWGELPRWTQDCDLLVNATPLGMAGQPDFANFGFLDGLHSGALVYDLVYRDDPTALVKEAAERGLDAKDGSELLRAQAELAFALFTASDGDEM